ncbi:MAG: pyruvate, phosphate dikinase, partial [Planctomycetota bacterium]|nr:pyruvate, phosphate dikinase [Planctomycetota bacterium]
MTDFSPLSSQLFRTKGDTLAALRSYPELRIPPFIHFTLAEWRNDPAETARRARNAVSGPAAVRSSCLREDGEAASGAGEFLSLLDVDAASGQDLEQAVEAVFGSYGEAADGDQVIVQAMVPDVSVSGVIMTRVPDNGAPYSAIDYDDESGRTDTITGGTGVCKTVFIYRHADGSNFDSERVRSYVEFARRIESICGRDDLDIEFCQDRDGAMHLFQVRPLCTRAGWIPGVDAHLSRNIGH